MNRGQPSGAEIAVAALLGAIAGAWMLDASSTIDGALVLAGVVRYPPESVMGVYYLNSWTALHQAAAVSLLNAAYGACSVCGLLLLARRLVANRWAALAVMLVILHFGLAVRFDDYGQGFSDADYGPWAATLFFLALGLLAGGHPFAAGLVAFAAPAVHPVVGAWTIAVIGGAVLCAPAIARRFGAGALAGATLCAASFLWFWMARLPSLPGYDAELFRIYMEIWDGHRRVPSHPSVLAFGLASACVLAGLLGRRRRDGNSASTTALIALLMSTLGAMLAYEAVHRWGAWLPDLFVRAMPARFSVLHLTLLPLIALCAFLERRWNILVLPALAALAALLHPLLGVAVALAAGVMLFRDRPVLPAFARTWPLAVRAPIGVLICALCAWQLLDRMVGERWQELARETGKPAVWLSIQGRVEPRPVEPAPPDYFAKLGADAPRLARTLHRQGVVATPDSLDELAHRRLHLPILLVTGSFDFVPYLPDTVTQVAGIVQDVYGIDFRHPADVDGRSAGLVDEVVRPYWPTVTPQDWIRYARKYCIGGVLAPSAWAIQLPLGHDFGAARYYRIETDLPPGCR